MKTILITGASRGIGKAIAQRFAHDANNIAICSRKSMDELEETAKEITNLGSACIYDTVDIADYESVERFIKRIHEEFGKIDVLVNNAGISYIGLLQDMTVDEWKRIINVNLSSVFYTCKLVIPDMISKKKGSIINISSMWGVCGASCEVAYSATKGGVNSFSKALAKELAPSNINVNAIACGVIDTRMNACFSEEERAAIINEIPAQRMGTPTEVAELVANIADSSSYLTGQVIAFDGGYM